MPALPQGLERVDCPLCGSGESREIFRGGGVRVVGCDGCGFQFQNPRPLEALRAETQKDEGYYAGYSQGSKGRRTLFRHRLRHLHSLSPGRILDVGCGLGEFLEVAREEGWNPIGIDVSQWVCAHLRTKGFANVRQTTLTDACFPENSFRAAHLSHVLEHLADPVGLLREVRRVLEPGGLVLIDVPNEARFRLVYATMNLLKDRGSARVGPAAEHLSLFTPRTLRRAILLAGLEPLLVRAEGFACPGRAEAFVQSRSLGVRLAVAASRLRLDLVLGLGRFVFAVARKSRLLSAVESQSQGPV